MSGTNGLYPLDPHCPGDRTLHLFGRAIVVPRHDPDVLRKPLDGWVFPELPPKGPDLHTLCKDLIPTPVKGIDYAEVTQMTSATDANLLVGSALKGKLNHKREKAEAQKALKFSRLRMQEQPRKIRELLRQEKYWKPIAQHFEADENATVAVVVDVFTATDLAKVNWKSKKTREQIGVQAPIDKITGVPGAPNLGAGVGYTGGDFSFMQAQFKNDLLVGCGYVFLSRRKPGWLASVLKYVNNAVKGTNSKPKLSVDDIVIDDELTLTMRNHFRAHGFFGEDTSDEDSEEHEGGSETDNDDEGMKASRTGPISVTKDTETTTVMCRAEA